jgi:hypothetical protein
MEWRGQYRKRHLIRRPWIPGCVRPRWEVNVLAWENAMSAHDATASWRVKCFPLSSIQPDCHKGPRERNGEPHVWPRLLAMPRNLLQELMKKIYSTVSSKNSADEIQSK